jgi:hypothetical protein
VALQSELPKLELRFSTLKMTSNALEFPLVKQEDDDVDLGSSARLTKSGATRASAQQKRELQQFFDEGIYRTREEIEALSARIGL